MAAGHKTGGRLAGTPNRITTAFKDAVRIVYEDIGGHSAFAAWARENQTEFYRIAARLIPTEIATTGKADPTLRVVLVNFGRDEQGRVIEMDADDRAVPMLPGKVEH